MKITVICDVLGQPNNGTTIATLNLIRYLRKKGHEVTVVSSDEETDGEKNHFVVRKMNFGPLNNILERNGVSLAKADKKILTEAIESADAVHIQFPFSLGSTGAKLAKKMHKPLTASFHCQAENVTSHIGMMNVPFANRLVYRTFYRNVYRYCDVIHYPTRFIQEVFEKEAHPTEGRVISNGVNDEFFRFGEQKRVSDKFTIVCTGRYSKEKSQITLIEAIALSRHKSDIKVIFAGGGPDESRLKHKAEALHADCEFHFYTRSELSALLHGADLYVHTALIEIEAISCMEAIACGLVPVICNSKRSATRFFAIDENNLFEEKNAVALAEKIDFWYENESLKREYVDKYAEVRKSFSQSACMEEMEKMLLNTIDGRKQAK